MIAASFGLFSAFGSPPLMPDGTVADISDSFQIFFENGDPHLFCDEFVVFVPDKSDAFFRKRSAQNKTAK